MKFMRKSAEAEHGFQMTAMVDVVFILLSFFVLGMNIRQPERDFAMGYGGTMQAIAGLHEGDLPSQIAVKLKCSGSTVSITIGQVALPSDDYDAIRAKLTEINAPSVPVTLVLDGQLSVEQVAKAMDAVLSSPMKKVSVARLDLPGKAAAVRTGA